MNPAGERDVGPTLTTRSCPVDRTEGPGHYPGNAPDRSVAPRIVSPAAGGAVAGRGAEQGTAAATAPVSLYVQAGVPPQGDR